MAARDVKWIKSMGFRSFKQLAGFGCSKVLDLKPYTHNYINAHYAISEIDSMRQERVVEMQWL